MSSDYLDERRRSLEQAALTNVVASNALHRDAIIEFLDQFEVPNAITVLRREPADNAILLANLAFTSHFIGRRPQLILSTVLDFVRIRAAVIGFVRRFIDTLFAEGRSSGAISTYTSDRWRFLTNVTSYRFRGFDNDDYALSFVDPVRETTCHRQRG
ncbi:MAG: hypothetical protein FJX60_02750 [Alphaproteobacteria bacterium]|nr:hypothetical protein [Alphaproteobacteria bacterium]